MVVQNYTKKSKMLERKRGGCLQEVESHVPFWKGSLLSIKMFYMLIKLLVTWV